jgi:hypothetical protein
MEYNNHLKIGTETVLHKGKNIATTMNNSDFEKFVDTFKDLKFRTVKVPIQFERRADLIANHYLGTPLLDWMICWYNNIEDPFQELVSGKVINIPILP